MRGAWFVIPVTAVAVAAGVVWAGDAGPSPSRAAADRACGQPYVVSLSTSAPLAGRPRLDRFLRVAGGATALVFAPDGRGFVGGRTGRIVSMTGGRAVIDLSRDTQREGDGGLLGLAFSPGGDWLYVYRSDRERDEVVTAYPMGADGLPDTGRERTIIEIDHPPSEQHHGGGFAFGPDGYLYIGTGDGGGLGDPRGNGQRLSTLLGKVLRIDPTPAASRPYRIPVDNPFVDRPGARPEIWAYGLRNPFRLSFDSESGDLWIGDVGQSCWEEIDRLPARAGGANLGWDRREGTHPFEGGPLPGAVDPVHSYSHRGGRCAVVAGFVYRGRGSPLDGALLYTDYCGGRVYAVRAGPGPLEVLDVGLEVASPTAIIAGPDGAPWLLTLEGDVFRVGLPSTSP